MGIQKIGLVHVRSEFVGNKLTDPKHVYRSQDCKFKIRKSRKKEYHEIAI